VFPGTIRDGGVYTPAEYYPAELGNCAATLDGTNYSVSGSSKEGMKMNELFKDAIMALDSDYLVVERKLIESRSSEETLRANLENPDPMARLIAKSLLSAMLDLLKNGSERSNTWTRQQRGPN